MTIKIKVFCETGYIGADYEDELEFEMPDGSSDEEIEEACRINTEDWVHNLISSGYERIE